MQAIFISFPASNYEKSKKFYEQAICLNVAREYEGKPHRFTNYDLGGIILKLYEWTEVYYGSGHSGLFIETDNLDDVINRISSFGAKTNGIIVHEWGGRSCSVTDPFGNIFDLIDANQKGDI